MLLGKKRQIIAGKIHTFFKEVDPKGLSPKEIATLAVEKGITKGTLLYIHLREDGPELGWDWLSTFNNSADKLMLSPSIKFILINGEAYARHQLEEAKALLFIINGGK